MFDTPFEHIFSISALTEALSLIKSKGSGIDREFLDSFKRKSQTHIDTLHRELMSGKYTPQPIKKISIPKNDKEFRPIALASIRDKVVQRALVDAIEPYFDKQMSNKSYGYRRDKGPIRAIGRCNDFINRGYFHIYKTDIDNYFETINHDILLNILYKEIRDKKIVRLISLYLQNGGFRHHSYIEHDEGVHQGDILSPLLSNIYLNEMDRYLERNDISFVRYADDFVLFFKDKNGIDSTVEELTDFLKTLNLKIEKSKSYYANIFEHGFTFLGVFFKNKHTVIDNDRLQKKISKLFEIARESPSPKAFVEETNLFIDGLSRYYLKIIDSDSKQFKLLRTALIDASAQFVYLQRKNEKIKTKKRFKEAFKKLYLLKDVSATEHKETIERIISKGFEKYLSTKTYKADESKLIRKKQKYAKSFASSSVLYVSQYGAYLGMSKNSITVKVKGRVVAKIPKHHCEQIIIAGQAISISSNMVYMCSQNGIAIDFVDDNDMPFASMLSIKSAYPKMALKQIEMIQRGKTLDIAKKFIIGKTKNQLNYLKYLNRYHNDVSMEIEKISSKIENLKKAQTISQLMGYEGEIGTIYWYAISLILKEKIIFAGRKTKGAKDLMNASLNYGYAILYARVQNALLKAGLALHISFLHSLQEGKPTLVYDLVEEFRAFVVDRAIVSMINKNEPLKIDDSGRLTKESCYLIVKNVKERLGVYTKYRGSSKKVENIIQEQAYLLARYVKGEAKYKPFIGKY